MGNYRVIIGGITPAAGEVWSVGVSLDGPDATMPQADISQWALGIANAIKATVSDPLHALLSGTGGIDTVRCEQRSETDETLLRAGEAQIVPPRMGTGGASKVLQASVCISLRTQVPGRSYRGRVYWPAWAYNSDTQLLFPIATVPTWLNSFVDMIEMINAQAIVVDPGYAMILVVRSRLLHVGTPVTSIAIGNVPDTQRRRRDAINEQYTILNV